MSNLPKPNYILLGYKSCGKTSLGRSLALHVNYDFLDLDEIFANTYHQAVPAFVEQYGLERFRCLEHKLVQQLQLRQPTVLACGGGVVEHPQNHWYLNNLGLIIHIDLDYAFILQHLQTMGRVPNFVSEAHYQYRLSLYQSVANIHFQRPYLGINADALALALRLTGEEYGK